MGPPYWTQTLLKQKHQFFVALLCLVDSLIISGAALGAWAIRRSMVERTWPEDLASWLRESMVLLAVPLVLFLIYGFGLYRPRRDKGFFHESSQILKAGLGGTVGLIVLMWAMGPELTGGWVFRERVAVGGAMLDAGQIQVGAFGVLLSTLLLIERLAFRFALRAIRRRGWNLRHVAVIGTGRLGRIACRTLDRNSWTGIHVAYFISHHERALPKATCVERPVLGGLADLERIFEHNKPDAVYLAVPTARAALIPPLLKRLERFAVDVRIIPDVPPRYLPQSMSVSELEGMPILSVRECPLYGLGGVAKRVVDILGALAALAVFGVPMAIIAMLVRSGSDGPAIFKQRRVSLGGEEFDIYKFRTMYHAEDEQANGWTRRDDPRITRIGRWLRRTSLDELPQLFNVLSGEMSLVGPRPERPELIARFRDDWRGYMLRQHVKAGITGWAQVNGLRGDTSLKKRLQHDLFYIRHWSLGFDLKILWLTLFRGFVHRNAH